MAIGIPLAVVAGLAAAGTASGGQTSVGHKEARITDAATLGDIPLAEFSNALLPGTVREDRGVDLGGIGSDLYPADRKGEFWTVTDRGPNGQIKVDGKKRRTFRFPDSIRPS